MSKTVATQTSRPVESAARIRIVLIEDHAILRDGLRALLALEPELEVVGEADSAAEGCRVAERAKPDLIITDIALPGGSGLNIIPELKTLLPEVRVLVLTAHFTDEHVRAALAKGADGYILKDSSRSELLEGVRTVLRGRQYFSSPVASRVVSGYLGQQGPLEKSGPAQITEREKEVLKLIAMANSTKRIAQRLNLSVKTVEKHRSNLMRKLELHNTAAVTLYAIRHKLVPADIVKGTLGEMPEDEGAPE
jgi:DNA-binding NarL/FixJ family response regulator